MSARETLRHLILCLVALLGTVGGALAQPASATFISGPDDQQGPELRVFQLQHVKAESVVDVLGTLFSKELMKLSCDPKTNTVIVLLVPEIQDKVQEVVRALDDPGAAASGENGKDDQDVVSFRVEATIWEVDDRKDFDSAVKKVAGSRLPLEIEYGKCEQVIHKLHSEGMISNPVRLQGSVLEKESMRLESGARAPVVTGVSRNSRTGRSYSYNHESFGSLVELKISRSDGGALVRVSMEDSRLKQSPENSRVPQQGAADAQDENQDLMPTPPAVVQNVIGTTMRIGKGNAEIISIGGSDLDHRLRLLFVLSVSEE